MIAGRGAGVVVVGLLLWRADAAPLLPVQPDRGALALHSLPHARFSFGGVVGERVNANVDGWLLPAPVANPGMIGMFRLRDRTPPASLVPWAGEFAGKYLISAVQALRLTERDDLRARVAGFVGELLSSQADDGYFGPFPRDQRLLGHWDLWGHYHVMQGLLLWHERRDDKRAFTAVKRAADLVCATYLDQPRRVFDAGSHEMNMAIHHVMAQLHRLTSNERYERMAKEIEKDWQRAGNYLEAGLAGIEFFASPRPRWESLHDLQGLVERWRVTGDARYRKAFEHHWHSIARWDIHNAGSFSSGEQASGNQWATGPIETCCTVAWIALSVDMLRLTGNSVVADELERATLNGGLGSQHPSGRWWTYNTPMDGVREASAHTIVFQARAGTPELNCCSVNGPRTLGMLSDWAVMSDEQGLVVNWHGPLTTVVTLPDGTPMRLVCETDLPRSGRAAWKVEFDGGPRRIAIRWRIPGWSAQTTVRVVGAPADVRAGQYLVTERDWKSGDAVEFEFDMNLRAVPGEREALGKASIFRGPLLLAYDQRFNDFDEADIPPLAVTHLTTAKPVEAATESLMNPWVLIDLPTPSGRSIRLCDFASAGATGTRYRSWLAVGNPPAPAAK